MDNERIEYYARAKTADNMWATVNILDLDERSFRRLILRKVGPSIGLMGVKCGEESKPYRTGLLKEETGDDE